MRNFIKGSKKIPTLFCKRCAEVNSSYSEHRTKEMRKHPEDCWPQGLHRHPIPGIQGPRLSSNQTGCAGTRNLERISPVPKCIIPMIPELGADIALTQFLSLKVKVTIMCVLGEGSETSFSPALMGRFKNAPVQQGTGRSGRGRSQQHIYGDSIAVNTSLTPKPSFLHRPG